MLGGKSSASHLDQAAGEDNDGFEPIRTTTVRQSSETKEYAEGPDRYTLEVCVAFLTVGPTLQSASGEPTRDKVLTELILDCAETRPEIFLLICPIFFEQTRRGFVNLSVKNLDSFLDELSRLLQLYEYARSKRTQLLAAQFLNSTLDIWASRHIVIGEVLRKVRDFCDWLSRALRKQKIRDWVVRDFLARFLDRYLVKDPHQHTWSDSGSEEACPEHLPGALLPMMTSDEDIRVRFRVAVINARLFSVARHVGLSALELYSSIKEWYTVDLDKCESSSIVVLALMMSISAMSTCLLACFLWAISWWLAQLSGGGRTGIY